MSAAMKLAYKRDVNDPLVTFCPDTLLMRGDKGANIIELTVMDGGSPADLSGYTAVVMFQRPGDSDKIRCPGSISGNVVSVTLLGDCYAYSGQYYASLVLDASGFTRTILRLAGHVENNGDGPVVDPTGTIPGYEDIARIYAELEESLRKSDTATSAANAAAHNANEKAAIADTAAGNANTAAGNANAGAGRANEAAGSIEGLTVEASDVAYNQPATAEVSDVEGHKHIEFGLRQGVPGAVPNITFTGETGEPNTDVVVTQSGPPEAPVVNLKIPQGVPGTGNVSTVDGVGADAGGNVALSAVRYVAQTLEDAQKVQARENIGAQASIVHNYTYDGKDLSEIFTASELHQKVSSGDFSGIQNGDYWPITLNGTVKDYATGETKTLSNAVFNLEANIQVYKQYGDTAVPNHILFCSRDLLPWAVKMRSADTTWYNDSETNPWRGSHLFQTLNAADGVLPLVAATGIGAHMYAGPNGGGMRFLLETKATGATTAVNWGWGDRGKLFLPTEREVWGQDIWSEHTWGGGAAVQWPVFAGSLKHIIKGLGNGGPRSTWWCQSSYAGSAAAFADVSAYGNPDGTGAATAWLSAPLCFLFV